VERSWLNRPIGCVAKLDWEKTLYIILIVVALATRLWGLGDRVQSHDECNHTAPSWGLYRGRGYTHTPITHGPFLFHVTALSYSVFGDDDFTSRLPVALLGVALVALPYLLRRWLGRAGALSASFFLLISPSIAFYSRYIRHDIVVIVWSLLLVWAVFSYLRDGRSRWLFLLAAVTALMFCTKEVAYIYNAIAGVFLILLLAVRALQSEEWETERMRRWCWGALAVVGAGVLLLGLGLAVGAREAPLPAWATIAGVLAVVGLLAGAAYLVLGHLPMARYGIQAAVGATALAGGLAVLGGTAILTPEGGEAPLALLAVGGAVAVAGLGGVLTCVFLDPAGREVVRPPRSLLVLLSAVCVLGLALRFALMPVLRVLPATRDTCSGLALPPGVGRALLMLPLVAAGVGIVAWVVISALRRYRAVDLVVLLGTLCLPFLAALLIHIAGLRPTDYSLPNLYYSVPLAAYAFVLSAVIGIAWQLRRQRDGKGVQEWLLSAAVYYPIVIVLYTTFFTNGMGIGTGFVGGLGYWLEQQDVNRGMEVWYCYIFLSLVYEYLPLLLTICAAVYVGIRLFARRVDAGATSWDFVAFLLWWTGLAWVGYSYAGEKMPWLLTHIALPMILLSGWFAGRVLEGFRWREAMRGRSWSLLVLVPALIVAIVRLVPVLGAQPAALLRPAALVVCLVALVAWVLLEGEWRTALKVVLLGALAVLAVLTIRVTWRLCYIEYDNPTEYMVYAHGGPAVDEVMEQIKELSRRVYGDPYAIAIADDRYGTETCGNPSTLMGWQLRNFRNVQSYHTQQPFREQLDAPVIIAAPCTWGAVGGYAGDDYVMTEYVYMWWPMQDYWHLDAIERTWEQDPRMGEALWDIWYDRDYTLYDEVTGKNHTLDRWPLRSEMRVFIRKDVLAGIWDLGSAVVVEPQVETDPYAEGWQTLEARLEIGAAGSGPGELQGPRGIAVGPGGSIYVADTGNSRVQVFSSDGELESSWGDHSADTSVAEGFYEPWDLAVLTGTVYVADTWNHRVQALDLEGEPIEVWGWHEPYGTSAGGFFGPRGIAVGADGLVYVADTGNKVVQVFREDGQFFARWAEGGAGLGQLEEPVGIDVGPEGEVYVADTWNRRVQVFDSYGNYVRQWPILGWDSERDYPYLAVDPDGYVYVTDPGRARVLVFDSVGDYVLSFGQYGFDLSSFVHPAGIDVGEDGSIYVSDAQANRILVFDPLPLE
jgi:predicted membrane-bound mannosyltransferase/streptogramin lyase